MSQRRQKTPNTASSAATLKSHQQATSSPITVQNAARALHRLGAQELRQQARRQNRWMRRIDGETEARPLTLRPRSLDPRDAANLFSEKIDQQPDPSNARALRDNQHAQRDGR